jgi:hypothetical protein
MSIMAREIAFMNAINEALDQAMEKDEDVVLLGEDIAVEQTSNTLKKQMKKLGVGSWASLKALCRNTAETASSIHHYRKWDICPVQSAWRQQDYALYQN